jgi:hypothetical protein
VVGLVGVGGGGGGSDVGVGTVVAADEHVRTHAGIHGYFAVAVA